MSAPMFTPGPWFVSYTHDGNTEMAIDDEPGMQGERDYDLVTVTHGDPEELAANAALIASSPCLYSALSALVSRYEHDGIPNDGAAAVDAARAALAKARGEA